MSKNTADWNMFDSTKLVEYAKRMGEVDASLESYLLQVEKGKASLKDYNNYITGTTAKLKGLKTTLVSVGKGMLLDFGIGVITAVAVKGISILIDAYKKANPSVEELNKRVEESQAAYESAKTELESVTKELESNRTAIEQLEAKDKLTYAEQGQLDELREITKELELQEEIAKRNEANSNKDLALNSIDALNKEHNVGESSIENIPTDNTIESNVNYTDAEYYVGYYKQAKQELHDLIQEKNDFLKSPDFTLDAGSIESIDSEIQSKKDSIAELENEYDEYLAKLYETRSNIKSYYDSIKDTPYEELTTEQKKIIKEWENINNSIDVLNYGKNGNKYNSEKITSLFDEKKIALSKEKLIDLYNSGNLDENYIEKNVKLKEAIDGLNLSLDDGTTSYEAFINEIAAYASAEQTAVETTKKDSLSKSDMIDQINDMSDAFSVLDDIYADVKDGDTFDFSKLDSKKFAENFKDLDAEYTAFIETVSASPNDLSKCQAAFDKLTEAYINQQGFLNELTDENASVAESMLINMGISNAHEVVQEKLQAQNELVANSLNDIDLSNQDVSDSANETIEQMITEGKVSGTLATQMYNLYIQENILNNNKLDMSQKIQELTKLAVSYGIAADSASNLNTIENDIRLAKNYGGSDWKY